MEIRGNSWKQKEEKEKEKGREGGKGVGSIVLALYCLIVYASHREH